MRISAATPPLGGTIKTDPDDFCVTEVAQYEPSGEGDHCYFLVEKRGRTTDDLVQALRRAGGDQVGVAGQKDRHAVTRQWVSALVKNEEAAVGALEALDGVRVIDRSRHGNKLKIGHLRGNRFQIRVRGVEPDLARVDAITATIESAGLPNLFGEQRFGKYGDNAEKGRQAIAGKLRGPKNRIQFFISALQSDLFNRYVELRHAEGLLRRVIAGDVLKKSDSGGMFLSEDLADEQARFDRRELSPAGPLFGAKMAPAHAEAAALEDAVLEQAGLTRDDFNRAKHLTTGSRRAVIVYPEDLSARLNDSDLVLTFFLQKGSFATTLLQEYTGELS